MSTPPLPPRMKTRRAPSGNLKDARVLFSLLVRSFSLLLYSFWTTRGQRCRPFSPLVHDFSCIAQRVQHSQCSSILLVDLRGILLSHALELSASYFFHKKKPLGVLYVRTTTAMHKISTPPPPPRLQALQKPTLTRFGVVSPGTVVSPVTALYTWWSQRRYYKGAGGRRSGVHSVYFGTMGRF